MRTNSAVGSMTQDVKLTNDTKTLGVCNSAELSGASSIKESNHKSNLCLQLQMCTLQQQLYFRSSCKNGRQFCNSKINFAELATKLPPVFQ